VPNKDSHRKLYQIKLKFREITTPIHFAFGFLLAALFPYYPVASVTLLAAFAFSQWWEYHKKTDIESDEDFWEGYAALAIGMGIVLILTILDIYPV